MAEENLSTGGDNEIEYIPFYGELRMTTFTTDDRKAATKAKRIKTIKEKPHTEEAAIAAAEMLVEVANEPITKEIVTARTEAVVQEIKESKAHVRAEVLREAQPDVAEPGVTDVALSIDSVDVIRRGFTTLHMARAFRNTVKNAEDYLIVELRDVQNAILAYYVTHKREEL